MINPTSPYNDITSQQYDVLEWMRIELFDGIVPRAGNYRHQFRTIYHSYWTTTNPTFEMNTSYLFCDINFGEENAMEIPLRRLRQQLFQNSPDNFFNHLSSQNTYSLPGRVSVIANIMICVK